MNRTPRGWNRLAIAILTGTEGDPRRRWVKGYQHDDAPGLAVTPTTAYDLDQIHRIHRWSVTHVATGREIAELSNEQAAKRIALRIAKVADWAGPIEGLKAQGDAIMAAVDQIVAGSSGRITTLAPATRRPLVAAACEHKARTYLLKAMSIHEHRNDSAAAARVRGALSYLPTE